MAFITIVTRERSATVVYHLPLSPSTSPATTMKRWGLLVREIQSLASHEAFVPTNVILLIPHPRRPPRYPLRHFLPRPSPLYFRLPRPTSLLSSALSLAAISSTSNRGSAAKLSSSSSCCRPSPAPCSHGLFTFFGLTITSSTEAIFGRAISGHPPPRR
ncbi:hypothetical protein ACLOJK_038426 [Asimina triloba]